MTAPRTAITVLALLGALVGAARAQPQAPHALSRVDFGWNTTITAGRWTPVRVWLDGSVGKAGGVVTIEYEQDRTQKAQVMVPASTTPGRLTPVDLAVCIPADVGTVTVTFQGEGVRTETMEFTPPPTAGTVATPRPGEQRLGQLFGGTRGLVVHLGVGSVDRAFPKPKDVDHSPAVNGRIVEGFTAAKGEMLGELKWMQLAATGVQPEELSAIPAAYEGLEALVLDAAKVGAMSPWTRGAIQKWVAGGGRLVLLATDDSGAWRSWFPEGPEGDVVAPGVPGRVAVPASVAAGLTTSGMEFELSTDQDENGNPVARRMVGVSPDQLLKPKTTTLPEVAMRAEVVARPIEVTEAGRAAGWTVGWAIGGGAIGGGAEGARAGLYAQGPVGMGMVTVLGVDPEGLPAALNAQATARLWRQVLAVPLANYLSEPFQSGHPRDQDVTTALNMILGVPPLKDTVFNVVLISLVSLAMLMGPVDWLVLKRYRARQHSWLTALGWISLASVAAYVIPPLLRSGPPQVNRLTVTDVLQGGNSLTSGARAWQNGLTGVFASGPLTLEFDASPGSAASGSWWHGVAPEQSDYRAFMRSADERRGLRTISPIATAQLTSREGERQNVPGPIRMPSWSYRTMADQSAPASPRVRAEVGKDAGGVYQVRLAGLPEGVPVARLTVYDRDGRVAPDRQAFTGASGAEIRLEGAVPERGAPGRTFDMYGWREESLAANPFHWSCTIPGAAGRDAAVQARLACGRWVMVEVVLGGPGPTSRFMSESELTRHGYVLSGVSTLRILVPLAGDDAGKEPTP